MDMELKVKRVDGKNIRCIKDDQDDIYVSIFDFSRVSKISLSYCSKFLNDEEFLKADKEDDRFPKQLFKGRYLNLISTSGLKACIENTLQPKNRKDNAYKIIDMIEETNNIEEPEYYYIQNNSNSDRECIPNEINKHIEYLNNQIESLRKQIGYNDKSFIVYRTRKERLQHKAKKDQSDELIKQLKHRVEQLSLTNVNINTKIRVWNDIWDEVIFQVTGLDSTQLQSQRNVFDSDLNKMMKISELEELVNVLEYLIIKLRIYYKIDKDNVSKLIHDLCYQYEKGD